MECPKLCWSIKWYGLEAPFVQKSLEFGVYVRIGCFPGWQLGLVAIHGVLLKDITSVLRSSIGLISSYHHIRSIVDKNSSSTARPDGFDTMSAGQEFTVDDTR